MPRLPSRPSSTPRAAGQAAETPAAVLLIRHAEKPADPADPRLSTEGRRRAEALARWVPHAFPGVEMVFAASARPRSNRPAETVQPLAAALGLAVDTRFGDGQEKDLAQLLLGGACLAATVLACWRHDALPGLARALGALDAPACWDAAVFDQVWRLDYGRGRPPDLQILSQPEPKEAQSP